MVVGVEFGIVRGEQGFLVLVHIFRSFASPLVVTVIEYGHWLAEAVYLGLEGGLQLAAVFPVDAALDVHVAGSGIVPVPGEMPGGCFLFDGLQGLSLVLRLVGLLGLVVGFPQAYKGMPVGIFGLRE